VGRIAGLCLAIMLRDFLLHPLTPAQPRGIRHTEHVHGSGFCDDEVVAKHKLCLNSCVHHRWLASQLLHGCERGQEKICRASQ